MKNRCKNLKRRAMAVAAVVLVGVLSMIVPTKGAGAEPLRLGIPRTIQSALVYLADTQGFLKKQGIDFVMTEYEAGALAVNDLIADKVDIITAGEFVFVKQSLEHRDLRIPASICMSSDEELVVRKDRGIAYPQDLKGKRVAVVRGGSTEFFLYNYLVFNRIPAGSVRVVYKTPSEMVKALVDGTIDAALCWPPYTTEMGKQLGARVARWPAQSGQDYYQALLAKEKFLKTQPKMMEQFLVALSDAEGFIAKHPDRAQAILRNRLKIDAEPFHSTWSHSRFQLQLSQDMLVLMEREARWAIRNKLVDKKELPNYLDYFYFQALEKVKPEGVNIVH